MAQWNSVLQNPIETKIRAFVFTHYLDADLWATSLLVDVADLPAFDHQITPTGIAVYAPLIAGDMDADGDVDLLDFGAFHSCVTGPGGGPVVSECWAADIDGDGDVD